MPSSFAALVYPHQLWESNPAVEAAKSVFLVEDPLFFEQYRFHLQKRVLHRASMTEFMRRCEQKGKIVHRIESRSIPHSSNIGSILKERGIARAVVVEPTDVWLRERIVDGCNRSGIQLQWLEDPSFLTPNDVMERWAANRQHYHFTDFYMQQRKRMHLLIDDHGKPIGGKWTFDTENRKRLPRDQAVPEISKPVERPSVAEAKQYVMSAFPDGIGEMSDFFYPVTHEDASRWLQSFIEERLSAFGDFEDAISRKETILFHSVLTPMLNIGLLTPQQVLQSVMEHCDDIPINSLEGFVRQVIGWREFVRLVYIHAGTQQRTRNAWKLSRPLPTAFYTGTTGITPFDESVQRTLQCAYCHHIERLMVLGNFMLLCDIAPDAVYQWFMELFIDAYDWVMVPNVYGMSQHADGGLMTTKPYISGSAYILKMSDHPKGDWCAIWDALYWRFVDRERAFFSVNPRMRVMVGQLDRMGAKLDQHRRTAERFLEQL